MDSFEIKMRGKVWLYEGGKSAWHFILLPKGKSRDMREFFSGMERGFGSLPVEVTIRKTTWRTSIFPDSKEGAYLLPLKYEVRNKESIKAGDMVTFILKVLV
ncbi:MAG TPA: DUF1905 domain-containing protein [Candidatus Moranbacteria bacterium]|nr:MAG: hypothetical protein UW87_C0006G0017 [Candidatus Moranbacteria bacterium GW2011_GWC2_45_10]KKT95541.1 MAG: hypothetical protein UW95_C0001G0105 [Parcubacteria group bacterium GW2011_GWC1_45_14]HAV11052.1 DUF1905 domain-containing protein [Candidatus Moranbacteria bacterium]